MPGVLVALLIALGLYTADAPQSYLAHRPVCTATYPRGFDGFVRMSPYFRRRVLPPCERNVIPEIAAFCSPHGAA